ncbi:MAG: hypothetical protein JJV92_05790 [Desulfosarcina sp.]|nr:hypothetical protein [Desulfobacterales bacterium]
MSKDTIPLLYRVPFPFLPYHLGYHLTQPVLACGAQPGAGLNICLTRLMTTIPCISRALRIASVLSSIGWPSLSCLRDPCEDLSSIEKGTKEKQCAMLWPGRL